MPRLAFNESTLSLAVSKSDSLRTTVPIYIVQKMGLGKGDVVVWDLDKKGNNWIGMIKKK